MITSHRIRVLLADDNPDHVETLALLLRLAGLEVQIAQDGDEAVRMAREFHPHMVVLDIGMPRKDGFQAAAEIRGEPELQNTVLVAASGYTPANTGRTDTRPFDHYLVKPIDLGRLVSLVDEVNGSVNPGSAQDAFAGPVPSL